MDPDSSSRSNSTRSLAKTSTTRKKQVVKTALEEQEYIRVMGDIIERDYFPDLKSNIIQNRIYEETDASRRDESFGVGTVLSNDKSFRSTEMGFGIRGNRSDNIDATVVGSHQNWTPSFVHPDEDEESINPVNQLDSETLPSTSTQKIEFNGSLDEFLIKYTSEDNKSFSNLLEAQKLANREKHKWLYENEDDNPQLALGSGTHENLMAITSDSHSKTVSNESEQSDVALISSKDIIQPEIRSGWKYKAKNCLMYNPDGAQLTPQELKNLLKSKPKITISATRFDKCDSAQKIIEKRLKVAAEQKARQKRWLGKLNVDGKLESVRTDISPSKIYGGADFMTSESKTENPEELHNFVRTPSPEPGKDDSPIMTWGEVESTPQVISGGSAFSIAEPSAREQIAHKLDEIASSKRTKRVGDGGQTDLFGGSIRGLNSPWSPAFTGSKRSAKISSAALNLLNKTQSIRSSTSSISSSFSKLTETFPTPSSVIVSHKRK